MSMCTCANGCDRHPADPGVFPPCRCWCHESRRVDEHGRPIFGDDEVPDPWSPDSRFAQWHGRTCGPWTVITVLEDDHRNACDHGWIRSGVWSFVCRRCHPDAVDQPATSEHQGAAKAARKAAAS